MKTVLPILGAVCALAASAPGQGAPAADAVSGSVSGTKATLENARVRVEYDLAAGTYNAFDKGRGAPGISGARTRVNHLSSDGEGWRRTAAVRAAGDAKTLSVRCAAEGRPTLLLDVTLQPDAPHLALAAGVENPGTNAVQVKELSPLSGAIAFPADLGRTEARTLDGYGGAGETRVRPGAARSSPNNLLLTFLSGGQRRSLVLGGLAYREFCKFAAVGEANEQGRRRELAARLGAQARLAAYVDCGRRADDAPPGGAALRLAQGSPYTWGDAGDEACFASVVFDYKEIVFEGTRLDPAKSYVLGFSWWDFDNNGRIESVAAVGADGKRYVLLDKQLLPARAGKNQPPQERAVAIPKEAYASGTVRLVFTNDGGRSNAVVSELWLWEGGALAVPADLAAGKPAGGGAAAGDPNAPISAELKAADPVGKRVEPGQTFLGGETFYVDFVTADPFAALESYGLAVRAAQKAQPNIYDFPTSCGWYVGLFEWGQAQNYPGRSKYLAATTAGLVEETQKAADSGFQKYSRMAVRVVPDKYEWMEPKGVTQGGWWDDAHWARYGHYTAPYETTKKYCDGVRERGGLPFTYFQCTMEDREFRQTHADLLLGHDPNRGLDYSNPRTQEYMRKVYANLRAGGMAGMMFDYPDDCWGRLCAGGLEDAHATAGGAYRTLFALAKEGLGPVSWIHERVLGNPFSDITVGVVDSQRTWGDNSTITPEMISRSGLRWYKSRVLLSYDMDAKNLLHGWKREGYAGSDADGRRMLLTMAYVAASRLLLSTSYRDMSPECLFDFERTFPYHAAPRSARPVDMLVCEGWPKVYDFAVSPDWHQVTLFSNDDPSREMELGAKLSGDPASGGLGLDPAGEYHVYDFWNARYVGRVKGADRLAQTLRPGEARMLSVHRVEPRPQFLSTNRHVMQGYVDMTKPPQWDEARRTLAGTSKVVGGETYKVVIALNGHRATSARAGAGTAKVEPVPGNDGLAVLSLDAPASAEVEWRVAFAPGRP